MSLNRLLAAIRRFRASDIAERDLRDDLRGYVDQLTDEHVAAGIAPAEARRRALIELGGVESVEESVRAVRSGAALEQWWQDVRYALRGLRRTPAFTATVILTLGLGIGVNTSVFTVLNAALLKPVPYDRPSQLVDIGHRTHAGTAMESRAIGMSWSEIDLWRAETQLFEGIEATGRPVPQTWTGRGESINVSKFTPGLPALLGIAPRIGRVFTTEEVDERTPVIVISDSFWSRAFSRRPEVLGSSITLDGVPMTIIGVMPSAFRYGPAGGGFADAWTGLAPRRDPAVPGSVMGSPVFRLRAGLSPETALPMAQAAAERIQQAEPDATPWTPVLIPLGANRTAVRGSVQTPLTLLLAATGLVLLVACANIANLLSARSAGRRHELAMRSALGASRARLARLLLVEGAVLAALGGTMAVLLAIGTLKALLVLMPSRMLLRSGLFSVSLPEIDWRVLAFTVAATVIVTTLSALWPSIRGSRVGQLATLADANRVAGMSIERRRMSVVLQAIQVALALVLATGAGLFGASFLKIVRADLGFDPEGLLSVAAQLPAGRYKAPEAQGLLLEQALDRVRAIPGVRSATLGSPPPATGNGRFVRHGAREASGSIAIRYAGTGYFSTTGIHVVAGREFGPADTPSSTPVEIIDEAGARRLFGGESPLGQQFTYSPYAPEMTIVGVASVVAGAGFATGSESAGMYFAQSQHSRSNVTFVVRVDGDAAGILRAVEDGILSIDRDIKLTNAGPVTDYYERMDTYAIPRFYMSLISLFALMALVTAAVGLYGLLAYSVGQRQREIGVRVALGSSIPQIRWLVFAEAMRPVLAGLVMGLIGAWLATGALASFLYEVSPRDLPTFAWSAAVLLAVVLIATIGPVRRATGVDPIQALRAE